MLPGSVYGAPGEHIRLSFGAAGFADAVRDLLLDEQLRRRTGSAARARVEDHFTWDRSIDSLELVLHSLTNRPIGSN